MQTLPKCFLAYSPADRAAAAEFVERFDGQLTFLSFPSENDRDLAVADSFGRTEVLRAIRQKWLRDSVVTILLIGASEELADHIDWAIAASVYEDDACKRSGLFAITLPSAVDSTTRYVPPRFADNWASGTGYARWYRYPENLEALEPMIIDAVEARVVRAGLVNNERALIEELPKTAQERSPTDVRESG